MRFDIELAMSDEEDHYSWTTGRDPALLHVRPIDSGGHGVVHEVSPTFRLTLTVTLRSEISIQERYIDSLGSF